MSEQTLAGGAEAIPGASAGYWADALRRLRRDPAALLSGVVVVGLLLMALAAPWLAPYDPLATSVRQRLHPPSPAHWLGQDEVGRDILSRIIVGARVSLFVGFLSAAFGLAAGGVLGLVAGFFSRLDNAIMRVVDVIQAFPFVLRAIAVVMILGTGFANLFIAIGFGMIPPFSRLMRSIVLTAKEELHVEAARALGASDLRILARHILPHAVSPVLVYSTLHTGTAILSAAALSFLGLGINPPTPEWGAMASAGREYLRGAPHLVVFPSLAVFVTAWAFNILGDALRDALDPKRRGQG